MIPAKLSKLIGVKLQLSLIHIYVAEYEQKKQELLANNPEADPRELIHAIIEKPKYNSDNREPIKVTQEMMEAIEECLRINEWRRANGMSKQQMKKIDIHEYLVEKKEFNILSLIHI